MLTVNTRMTAVTAFGSPAVEHPGQRSLSVRTVIGEAIGTHSADIAHLRIAVSRAWPYLYEGDASREVERLRPGVECWRSVAVLVFDGSTLVGAAMGLPLAAAPMGVQEPFAAAEIDVRRVFLLGESVLLPAYRGRGLGHRFFDERESHARILGGFELTAFCTVDRTADDPRRPPFGRSHESFWRKRGYRPREDLKVWTPWNEIGVGDVQHSLTGWVRPLERSR